MMNAESGGAPSGSPPRCPEHGLVLSPAGACVVCRRASTPPPATPNRTRLFLGLSVGFAGLLFAAGVVARNHHRGVVRLLAASPGSRTLSCSLSNGEDRPGSLYIPRAAPERPLSLVVAFHGTNATGASMIELLREEADKRHFVIVAPDSGYVEDVSAYTWRVGGHPGDTSPDTPHIEACLNDVATHLGARLSSSGWLALGHSGGASSAPFLATHDPRFSAFAVLHGGIFEGGLGRGVP